MKQQLEQILKLSEETTNILREALASMDKPEINMEHGKWYMFKNDYDWLIKFDRIENKKVMVLDAFSIPGSFSFGAGSNCHINSIKSYSPATPEDMQLLPDGHPEKPKPALAATYEKVVDVVKPEWYVGSTFGNVQRYSQIHPYQLPTESAAEQARAYIQIKNLEAYCAANFEGERNCGVGVDAYGKLFVAEYDYTIIRVPKPAAEWLIANHPEPFLIFFGVKN